MIGTPAGMVHVTITAGGASADVTVSADQLPLGTVLWSNPGDGSGVQDIVPAVPGPSGVADVFAFQGGWTQHFCYSTCSVSAITSDGLTAWTADVSQALQAVPDFQSGLILQNGGSIVRLDGMTGHPYPAYSDPYSELQLVHPDGTVFAWQSLYNQDGSYMGASVIGIDPTTGTAKFSVPVDDPTPPRFSPGYSPEPGYDFTGVYVGSAEYPSSIIGGDGYAYFAYSTPQFDTSFPNNYFLPVVHLTLLRVDTSGNYTKIPVRDFTPASPAAYYGSFNVDGMISNADTGVVLSWTEFETDDGGGAGPSAPFGMAITTGTSVASVNVPVVTGQATSVFPELQGQDGSFYGRVGMGTDTYDVSGYNMVAFDQTGAVRWVVPNDGPAIATADGGLIGGSGVTYDQNGNATGQQARINSKQTPGWLGNILGYTYLDPPDSVSALVSSTTNLV